MRHKFFLGIFFGYIVLSLLFTSLRPNSRVSVRENRPLEEFPALSVSGLLTGEFQEQWEKALTDHIYGAEKWKQGFNYWKQQSLKAMTALLSPGIKEMPMDYQEFQATYFPRGENIFEIKESGNLFLFVYQPEELLPIFTEKINAIKKIAAECRQSKPDLDFYFYYIEGNRDIDFNHRQFPHPYQRLLQQEFMSVGQFACFSIDKLSDFTEQFYRTDHHWNHLGQARAYADIIKLLIGDGAAHKLTAHRVSGVRFVGSRARQIDDFSKGDEFFVNTADIGTYDTYVNGRKQVHGSLDNYLADQANPDVEISHYAECFGADKGLIEYDFHLPERQNLLVIADSYSNAINPLIASHFNRSYFVDLRHYEEDRKEKFDLCRFVAEHKIDKIVFMGSAGMIISDKFNF